MTAYNTYIEQLSRGKKAFLAEFQGLNYIPEVFRIIVEVKINFAKKVIERDNKKQVNFLKEELNHWAIFFYMANISR